MAALAQLAGGIAPALSDLITVIRGQAGVLLDRADSDPAAQEPLNQIYTAAERAGSLLRQLQIFSRQ
jgi:signal transduction histidine kinase